MEVLPGRPPGKAILLTPDLRSQPGRGSPWRGVPSRMQTHWPAVFFTYLHSWPRTFIPRSFLSGASGRGLLLAPPLGPPNANEGWGWMGIKGLTISFLASCFNQEQDPSKSFVKITWGRSMRQTILRKRLLWAHAFKSSLFPQSLSENHKGRPTLD